MTKHIYSYPVIHTDPREGGALNWLDCVDSENCILLRSFGTKPAGGTGAREQWIIKALREVHQQEFYFYPNTHRGMALTAEIVDTQQSAWPDKWNTILRIPLAHIFGLPNLDPAKELAQMREFLTFIDDRSLGQRKDGGDAYLQWFRGGYRNRGLDWVGFENKDTEKSCLDELNQWLEKPWLKQWKEKNLDGVGRLRMGPHCWMNMSSLVPDRLWAKVLGEIQDKNKEPQSNKKKSSP